MTIGKLRDYKGYLRPYLGLALRLESEGKTRLEIAQAINEAGCISANVVYDTQWKVAPHLRGDNVSNIMGTLTAVLGPRRMNAKKTKARRSIRVFFQVWTPESQHREMERGG